MTTDKCPLLRKSVAAWAKQRGGGGEGGNNSTFSFSDMALLPRPCAVHLRKVREFVAYVCTLRAV